jgi:hypothetical protein
MNISIALPDDVAHQMSAQWHDLPRRALQALAADAYRAGLITSAQVQRLLGLPSRWDVERFLQEAGAPGPYVPCADGRLHPSPRTMAVAPAS